MVDECSASSDLEEMNLLSPELTSYLPPQKTIIYRMPITPCNKTKKMIFRISQPSFSQYTSAQEWLETMANVWNSVSAILMKIGVLKI